MTWVLLPADHLLCLETGAAITLTAESTGGPWFIEHRSPGMDRYLSAAYEDQTEAILAFARLFSHLGASRMADLLRGWEAKS